jgi:hypothetical protein
MSREFGQEWKTFLVACGDSLQVDPIKTNKTFVGVDGISRRIFSFYIALDDL